MIEEGWAFPSGEERSIVISLEEAIDRSTRQLSVRGRLFHSSLANRQAKRGEREDNLQSSLREFKPGIVHGRQVRESMRCDVIRRLETFLMQHQQHGNFRHTMLINYRH
jgi:hypothetical protein